MPNLINDTDLMQWVYGRELVGKELDKLLTDNPSNSYAVFQLIDNEETQDYFWLTTKQMESSGLEVKRDHYGMVYAGTLMNCENKQVPEVLNDLYYRFNADRPDDFCGHSMSISDVVAVKLNGEVSVHYVDRWGWTELQGFLDENPLKNAEVLLEDDYGMIDGILNNGKRDPEKHHPSVAEQLRTPVAHKPKTSAKGKTEPSID